MWEVVPAVEDGKVIGYQVRWSQPDEHGRYLWVGHYYAGNNSLGWCENAAERDAENKNRIGKQPWEYHGFTPVELQETAQ